MNPYKDAVESSFTAGSHLNYEDVATKLLKDHYFLTALELHTELVESGRELPQLREFFSNPGNFEQHVPRPTEPGSMHRTPSQATLDSLDTARYSEDGGGDRGCSGSDVAVLEFELRKARETINSLRANLTQFADGDSALDKNTKDKFNQRSLKPHEKRALNFLINEYLLLQNYKLTSITFSDENPDQEFEDWDDVGLNMPRPAGLISLFWGSSSAVNVANVDASTETDQCFVDNMCQTDSYEGNVCVSCQTSVDNDTDWSHELLIQAEEIDLLKQKIIALETEKLNFQKLYDAAIVSLNTLTSPMSENKGIDLQIPHDKLSSVQATLEQQLNEKPLTCMASENHYGSGNSTHSATPDQFEMIENEKSSTMRKRGSVSSSPGDALSIADAAEWTRVPYHCATPEHKEMWIDTSLPDSLKESILNWCTESLNLNETLANDLLSELVSSNKPITLEGLLPLVADTLPRVVPHTLVARRGEAAALLAAAAALLPAGDVRRARLLHALLTLAKRPEPRDARAVCDAACLVVRWGAGGEVLSSVAELLAARSGERRLLAGRVCVAVAPYVPVDLCSSLLLSLVAMMCDSGERELRALGLRAACLVCPVAEHKYAQLENLMFNLLTDPVDKNVKDTIAVYAPLLARSALIAGKFSSDLYTRLVTNLEKASSECDWKSVLLYLDVMRAVVWATVAYIINVQIVRDVTLSSYDKEIINLEEVPLEGGQFMDLQCYMTDSVDAKMLLVAMNSYLRNNPEVRWTELSWFIDIVKIILEVAVSTKAVNNPVIYEVLITLFSSYVDSFGSHFASVILKPVFMENIADLENKLEKLHAVDVNRVIVVGIYLVTVLVAVEDNTLCGEFLQKWVVYSSLRSLPTNMLEIPLKWIAKEKPEVLNSFLQHLRELSGAGARALWGSLAGALAAVARADCVQQLLLPAAAALLRDEHAAVREEAITAWGCVTRACMVRGLPCEAQCWPPMEDAVARPLTAKECVKAAEALSLLVLPTVESPAVSEKAVTLLCALSGREEARAALGALAPGLRLAALRCPRHPALLPALRKLEEVVQAPALSQYKPAVEALLQALGAAEGAREASRAASLHAAHEVGRRVTQMFQHSKPNINLQNIFKKKT